MKKSILAVLILILMISLTGCKDPDREIIKRYKDLKSYTALTEVTVSGNKDTKVYKIEQNYLSPHKYRAEVISPQNMKGTVAIICGEEMWFKSAGAPFLNIKNEMMEEGRDYLSLTDFLEEYFSYEERQSVQKGADGKIMLSIPLREKNEKRFAQSLILNGDNYLPEKLITSDSRGNEMICVEYIDFKRNAEIPESVFLAE